MAKVIGPCFSITAQGKLGALIFETGPSGAYVKGHTPQRKKPTPAQIQQNTFFGTAADNWRELTPAQKAEYNERAGTLQMTGFNLYIKENIEHP